jgi:hypothetical protein
MARHYWRLGPPLEREHWRLAVTETSTRDPEPVSSAAKVREVLALGGGRSTSEVIYAVPRTDLTLRAPDGTFQDMLYADVGVGRHSRLAVNHELVRRYPEKFRLVSDPNRKSRRTVETRFGGTALVR